MSRNIGVERDFFQVEILLYSIMLYLQKPKTSPKKITLIILKIQQLPDRKKWLKKKSFLV